MTRVLIIEDDTAILRGLRDNLEFEGYEVLTRDELLDQVWGYDRFPTTRTVDNHISLLRSKIEDDPGDPQHVLTVHGVGYKLRLA